jgi:flagellar basal-body rod modification protein FlgD
VPGSARLPNKTLGQDDFLKLLTTQMSSQDPMDPQKDTDFIAQMAQFSSLEANTSMQKDLAAISTQQQFTTATALLGQTVTLQVDSNGVTTQGVVSSISMDQGTPQLIVNDTPYDLSQVMSVSPSVH